MPDSTDSDTSVLLFQEILNRIQQLDGKIDKIGDDLVGVENCKSFRLAFKERQDALEKRVSKVEYVCAEYGAVKGKYVDKESLIEAKGAVLEKAEEKDGEVLNKLKEMQTDINTLKENTNVLKLTPSDIKKVPGALVGVAAIFITVVGVVSGRINDLVNWAQSLGLKEASIIMGLIVLGSLFFVAVIVYYLYRGGKLGKRISGYIFRIMIILILVSPIALAQNITVLDDKPVVLPNLDKGGEIMASQLDVLLGIPEHANGDANMEDLLIQMKVAAFLGDENVTGNNTTALFYA